MEKSLPDQDNNKRNHVKPQLNHNRLLGLDDTRATKRPTKVWRQKSTQRFPAKTQPFWWRYPRTQSQQPDKDGPWGPSPGGAPRNPAQEIMQDENTTLNHSAPTNRSAKWKSGPRGFEALSPWTTRTSGSGSSNPTRKSPSGFQRNKMPLNLPKFQTQDKSSIIPGRPRGPAAVQKAPLTDWAWHRGLFLKTKTW